MENLMRSLTKNLKMRRCLLEFNTPERALSAPELARNSECSKCATIIAQWSSTRQPTLSSHRSSLKWFRNVWKSLGRIKLEEFKFGHIVRHTELRTMIHEDLSELIRNHAKSLLEPTVCKSPLHFIKANEVEFTTRKFILLNFWEPLLRFQTLLRFKNWEFKSGIQIASCLKSKVD